MHRDTFAIRSRRIVTPDGEVDGFVTIAGGQISSVISVDAWTADLRRNDGTPIRIDDFGAYPLLPGFVDSHVHVNEPGRTAWEGFATATRAAAAGGVTTIVDMPLNADPVTTTCEALEEKAAAARGKLWVDCGFYGGVVPGNIAHLGLLAEAGVLGFKAFLIESGLAEFTAVDHDQLRVTMSVIAPTGLPLLVHAERKGVSPQRVPTGNASFAAGRPVAWEVDAVSEVIRLSRDTGCRVHVVHLSSGPAIAIIRSAKEEGIPITVETCPHYLFFEQDMIPDNDVRFKCAPPIRAGGNHKRDLWKGLESGAVDLVASDHSPTIPELKFPASGQFDDVWGGISSLQLAPAVTWTLCRQNRTTLSTFSSWMSRNPATLVGLQKKKGAIASGFDADLVVWDDRSSFKVERDRLFHRHAATPYDGFQLYGTVVRTYLRGEVIFDGQRHSEQPTGIIQKR